MLDRETKYTKELAKCRENIKRTKSLIDYHKNMLKAFESKESELMSKLERVKMSSLCDIINKGGYDIDALREAVKSEISAVFFPKMKLNSIHIMQKKQKIQRQKTPLLSQPWMKGRMMNDKICKYFGGFKRSYA